MNDLERKLADALHTLTPEPPTAFRFAPPVGDAHEPAIDVIDLDGVVDLAAARRRRRPRLGALLAAAAVVALGSGIAVAVISMDRNDTAPAAPSSTRTTSALLPKLPSACRSDDTVVSVTNRTIGTGTVKARVNLKNIGTRTCALPKPSLGITQGGSGAVFQRLDPGRGPADADLVLRPGDRLVYYVTAASQGTCRVSAKGTPGVVVRTGDGFELTSSLGVAGCTLSPGSMGSATLR